MVGDRIGTGGDDLCRKGRLLDSPGIGSSLREERVDFRLLVDESGVISGVMGEGMGLEFKFDRDVIVSPLSSWCQKSPEYEGLTPKGIDDADRANCDELCEGSPNDVSVKDAAVFIVRLRIISLIFRRNGPGAFSSSESDHPSPVVKPTPSLSSFPSR